MSSFDLNLLRVLDALLREGSTVKAGSRIGLSQPAVSAALGRLRHALGDELFIRNGQGLQPTDFARSLANPLAEVLEGLETLLGSGDEFDPGTANNTFRLSGSDFFAELLLPQLAEQVSRLAPHMKVQLVGLLPAMYKETLEQYSVDIALMPRVQVQDWADHQPLMTSPFKIIARTGHRRLRDAGLSPGDIMPIDLYCDLGHVLFSDEGKLKALGDEALARVGRTRNVVMSMPFFSGVYRAVSESELVALVPVQLAERVAPKVGLEIFEPPVDIDPVELSMVWNRRSTATPAHRWLRNLIHDILSPLDARP